MSKKSHEKCRLNKRSVQVLPDFIPEKLKRVDPHLFFVDIDKGTHDLDGFILILALVVNEIHDVFFFDSLLTSHRIPKPEEISEFSGQWSGMRLGLWRRYIVIATEIMKATESAKGILTSGSGKEFLEYAELKSQANMTSKGAVQEPDSWGNWKALFEQSCATTRTTTGNKVKPSGIDATDFRGTLDKIRNTVAAHYDRDKGLGFGYKRFFFENAKHGGNEWAYLSDGRNLEKTRFFFADAAAQGAIEYYSLAESPNKTHDALAKHSSLLNLTLKPLVVHYLNWKTERLLARGYKLIAVPEDAAGASAR